MNGYLSVAQALVNRVADAFSVRSKKVIVDPLSCFVRLALLPYKPLGTKISILHNSIEFDDPQVQGSLRRAKGSTRNDITALRHIFEYGFQLYRLDNPHIAYIVNASAEGLKRLMRCYNPDNIQNAPLPPVCEAINLYITMIQVELDKIKQPNNNNSVDLVNNNGIQLDGKQSDLIKPHNKSFPHDRTFESMWNARTVHILYLLLQELASQHALCQQTATTGAALTDNPTIQSLIQSICTLLDGKDQIVMQTVSAVSVTGEQQPPNDQLIN